MNHKISIESIGKRICKKDIYSSYVLLPSFGEGTLERYEIMPGFSMNFATISRSKIFPGNISENANLIEIMYIVEGNVEIEYVNNRFAYIHSGDISMIECNRPIKSCKISGNAFRCFFLLIEPQKAATSLNHFLQTNDFTEDMFYKELKKTASCVHFPVNGIVQHICLEIMSCPEKFKEYHYRLKATELMLYLLSGEYSCNEDLDYFPQTKNDRIKNAASIIMKFPQEKITIEELASMVNLDRTTLQKLFKKTYGISISTFRRNVCMQHAKELLLNTEYTIAEISLICGYSNCSRFSSAFRNVFHELPSVYRDTFESVRLA